VKKQIPDTKSTTTIPQAGPEVTTQLKVERPSPENTIPEIAASAQVKEQNREDVPCEDDHTWRSEVYDMPADANLDDECCTSCGWSWKDLTKYVKEVEG